MSETTERLTWCLTTNGYANPDTCCDPDTEATCVDHDHYDVAVDEDGKVLWRYWPVGTVWETSEGYKMRLRLYDVGISDLLRDENAPERPVWDGQAPSGGAFSDVRWLPGRGDRIVEFVLAEGQRPAPGALFMMPNGEAWRLRGYGIDWQAEPCTGNNVVPSYSINLPSGAGTNGGDTLPDGARLVWHP